MTYNRLTFFIVGVFIGVACASLLAPLIVSGTQPGPNSMLERLPTEDKSDVENRLIVLDRIVGGTYGVFLVGLDEKEVIVSLGPECADLLSPDGIPASEGSPNIRERMEEKQHALRQRGSQFLHAR